MLDILTMTACEAAIRLVGLVLAAVLAVPLFVLGAMSDALGGAR